MSFDSRESLNEFGQITMDCARYRWLMSNNPWPESICEAVASGDKALADRVIDAQMLADERAGKPSVHPYD
jgi:hypothetical protein